MEGEPGPEEQWKVVKLEDDAKTSKFILSTLKWPCHFMFMDFMGIVKTTNNLSKTKEFGKFSILKKYASNAALYLYTSNNTL